MDKYNPPDNFLPESYTCFFLLKMPRYTGKAVLREKLKYAIHFCKAIGEFKGINKGLPLVSGQEYEALTRPHLVGYILVVEENHPSRQIIMGGREVV